MKISGILLLDKPQGISSNVALHKARAMLGAKKAGHAGTLDPLATGALPLAFGEATKTCTHLLDADKAYQTRATLGVRTATGDADGEVIETCEVPALSAAQIESALAAFRGAISQTPPMYSALKFQGEALYKLARRGVDVPRATRDIVIHRLTLLAFGPDWLELEVVCGSGTYIRALIEDIAAALGTCGHVAALRRLWVAPFDTMPMITLDELGALDKPARRALLAPVDAGLVHLPILTISAEQTERYLMAQRFQVDALAGCYRVYGQNVGLLSIGEVFPDRRLGVVRMLTDLVSSTAESRRAQK